MQPRVTDHRQLLEADGAAVRRPHRGHNHVPTKPDEPRQPSPSKVRMAALVATGSGALVWSSADAGHAEQLTRIRVGK